MISLPTIYNLKPLQLQFFACQPCKLKALLSIRELKYQVLS